MSDDKEKRFETPVPVTGDREADERKVKEQREKIAPQFESYEDIEEARKKGADQKLLNELQVLRSFHNEKYKRGDVLVVNVNMKENGEVKKISGIYLTTAGLTEEQAEDIVLEGDLSDGRVKIVSRKSAAVKLFAK